MKTSILILIHLAFPVACYAQKNDFRDLRLELKANTRTVKVDSPWLFTVFYTIKNVSANTFEIDTSDIPNYENNNTGKINFSFYYKNPDNRFVPHRTHPKDLQHNMDITANTTLKLKSGHSYTYKFRLLDFFEVADRGAYRIYASYGKPLTGKNNHNVESSVNFIEITVK